MSEIISFADACKTERIKKYFDKLAKKLKEEVKANPCVWDCWINMYSTGPVISGHYRTKEGKLEMFSGYNEYLNISNQQ